MPLDSPATRASRRLIHASHADVATIIEFHHLAHVVGALGIPTREQVTSRFDDPDTKYLIERDNRIVGFALVIVIEGWLGEIRRIVASSQQSPDTAMARSQWQAFSIASSKPMPCTARISRCALPTRSRAVSTNERTSFWRERGATDSATTTDRSTISARMAC